MYGSIFFAIFIIIFLFSLFLSQIFPRSEENGREKITTSKKIKNANRKLIRSGYFQYIQNLVDQAGIDNTIDADKFILIQETLFFLSGILFATLLGFLKHPAILLLISAGIGFLLPILFISRKARGRNEKILAEIPFFADLLTLSCEAGLDIFASFLYIVQNSEKNILRELIEALLREIKFGKSRQTVLREAYKKTQLFDLKTIYSTLLQAESLGTPIGKSLRNQVEIMRNFRMNRAEKLAQEAPLKLLIPLLFFIFPVTFMVLLSPIILKFFEGSLL